MFERPQDASELPLVCALARYTDGVAAVMAVEGNQWLVLLSAYEPDRPPKSIEAFRAACAKLPPIFGQTVRGPVTREIQTYRQADSRRRDFAQLERFPARLVSVGDAAASFNPIHGQGVSSAALHASCLSDYLVAAPTPTRAATEFFELQAVVTDAAWTLSAGGDAARLDCLQGNDVPDDVAHQRWALEQVLRATLVDQSVADAFTAVTYMLAHPSTLTDPALLERAVAINERTVSQS
jgi:2-polyprenyl-6-methoxyphenol hydroxylase-like FAD-dependent oxidoreductase